MAQAEIAIMDSRLWRHGWLITKRDGDRLMGHCSTCKDGSHLWDGISHDPWTQDACGGLRNRSYFPETARFKVASKAKAHASESHHVVLKRLFRR